MEKQPIREIKEYFSQHPKGTRIGLAIMGAAVLAYFGMTHLEIIRQTAQHVSELAHPINLLKIPSPLH